MDESREMRGLCRYRSLLDPELPMSLLDFSF